MSDPRIFISYRRLDSYADAGRLRDRLSRRFGIEDIFIDVDSIKGADKFERRLETAVRQAVVLLVVIGDRWCGDGEKSRLDSSDDIVRKEIEFALDADIDILPILLNDARLPGQAHIPQSIGALLQYNAIRLRHESYEDDYNKIESIVSELLKSDDSDPVPFFDESLGARSWIIENPCSFDSLIKATEIAQRYFAHENIEPYVIRKIYIKSPNSFSVIRDLESEEVLGYMDLFKIRKDAIDRMQNGEIAEDDFQSEDFLSLTDGHDSQEFSLYIGAVAISPNAIRESSKAAMALIHSFALILEKVIFVTGKTVEVYAVALSANGRRLLERNGFVLQLKKGQRSRGDGDLYYTVMTAEDVDKLVRRTKISELFAEFRISARAS